MTASAQSTITSKRTVNWERDVRPALETAVCVGEIAFGGRTIYVPKFGDCPPPPSQNRNLPKLTTAISETGDTFGRLPSTSRCLERAQVAAPEGSDRSRIVLQRFRHEFLDEPFTRRLVMPRVHTLLAAAGLQCPDCPGPTRPVFRTVTLAELLPYVVAYAWPSAIRPEGGVALNICVGINGLDRITPLDAELANVALFFLWGSGEAKGEVQAIIKQALHDPEYAKLDDDKAKLEFVRGALRTKLPKDEPFVRAVASVAQDVLPDFAMTCRDCAAIARATETPPVSTKR